MLICVKYFSSLERLRLAQEVSTARPKSASSHGIKTSKFDFKTSRPPLSRRNSSYFKNPPMLRPRSRKTPSPTTDTFSPSDAQWFLSLPDKVKRRHFTEEERSALSGRTESVIPDAADVRLYELCRLRETNKSVPTLHTSSSSSLLTLSTLHAPNSASSEVDMDNSMIETLNCFDNDGDLNLAATLRSTLDDYHTWAVEESVKPSKRQPSFRRVSSLNSLPFHANTPSPPDRAFRTSPTTPLATTPVAETFHHRAQSHARSIKHLPGSTHKASSAATDMTACHYKDPEARLKLRVYLASPQKFDEAIEFGFPSLDDADSQPLGRPSLSRSHYTAPCKTFLNDDDDPSIFDALDDDSDDDAASMPERGSPHTPNDAQFNETYLLSPSVAESNGSSSTLFARPVPRPTHSESFAQMLAGREPTLRMTLTRPDLRADEKALYAHTTGDDPLALEHLPALGNGADIWDQMPKETGFVRKMWRKVSGKGT